MIILKVENSLKQKKLHILLILSLVVILSHLCLNGIYYKFIAISHYNVISEVFNDLKDFRKAQLEESYRFFWDRSFHHPVLVTVHVGGEQAILNLTVVAHSHSTEHQPGEVITNKDIVLSKEQVYRLRKLVRKNRFRKAFIPNYLTAYLLIGPDGAGWTIEAKKKGRYEPVA